MNSPAWGGAAARQTDAVAIADLLQEAPRAEVDVLSRQREERRLFRRQRLERAEREGRPLVPLAAPLGAPLDPLNIPPYEPAPTLTYGSFFKIFLSVLLFQ